MSKGKLLEELTARGVPRALAHEHRRLMDEGHREVRWGKSTAAQLDEGLRAELRELWLGIAEAEHRSSAIFATFALDLAGAGAPLAVQSLCARAVLDELRHAELALRTAALYGPSPTEPEAGLPAVPDDPSLTMREQALRQALFLSVAAETFSTLMLRAQYDAAADPAVRDVLGVILADELHHARLGWFYLRMQLEDPERREHARAFVAQHARGVFAQLRASLFPEGALPPPSLRGKRGAKAREHGYLPLRESEALFRRAMRELWVPGFRALGFELG